MKRITITIFLVCLVLTFYECKKRQQPPIVNLRSAKAFSINDTKSVCFSQGNLQYQASTDTWRFAEHQWDFVGSTVTGDNSTPCGTVAGSSNHLISPTYDGWIDLFGWGTGNNPTLCTSDTMDYVYFYDWGNNTISNGDGKNWFTLTLEEWEYVLNERNTLSGIRFAKAYLNNVYGLIILPDDWNSGIYSLNDVNMVEAGFKRNRISAEEWNTILEPNGAVFLPVAGMRDETYIYDLDNLGRYWTATWYGGFRAYCIGIADNSLINFGVLMMSGLSVRLVRMAEN
ncbi:MAG: hypothetical protein J6W12_06865 [Bacteroidales bacterium]|nr:hypothetical protein [Bacteroidales bacterium]